MTAYFNEIDGAAAHVLETLIAEGVIADGIVDRRSIRDVQPSDLDGFTQCHFFAGAGLWSVAARMAGFPDNRPLWTGSCPCQPFSVAGKGAGTDDIRHLWPDFFRLIRASRPPVVMGEQVAGKAGRDWFHGVRTDLEGGGYAGRAVDIPALAVDAPISGSASTGSRETWRTPTAGDKRGGAYSDPAKALARMESGHTINLEDQMVGFSPRPTPTVADAQGGHLSRSGARGHELLLKGMMKAAWTTPLASDVAKQSENPETTIRRLAAGRQVGLNAHMALTEARTEFSGQVPTGSPATMEKRGAPNPEFASWLMGWPEELMRGVWSGIQSFRSSRQRSSKPTSKPK